MNTNERQEAKKSMQYAVWSRQKNHLLPIVYCLLLTAYCLLPTDVYAADLRIGRMKVSIMPEYESPDVLVIYEGKFADKDAFPNQVAFTLPKGVTKLTDVCSLSPAGKHFCQLYDIINKGEYNETSVKLPYADFFIDFKYSPFNIKSGSWTREFEYTVKAVYPIDTLEVSIQEPLRSKNFELLPKPMNKVNKKDLNYHNYTFKNIKDGEDVKFKIKYTKDDKRPSVDIKFSAMSKEGLIEKRKGMLLLGAGIIILIAFVVIRRLKTKS